jgi:hypothetical protein
MKANELRIGNLIKGTANAKVTPPTVYAVYTETFSDIDSGLGIFEPIPLTEEWLLKFGFKSINDSCGYRIEISKNDSKFWLTVFLSHDTDGSEVWGCNHADLTELEPNESFCSSIPVNIDYVHQLQNLYFALTGEELGIKKG